MNCWISPQRKVEARKWTPRIALAILFTIPILVCAALPCRADDAANEAVRELARKLAGQIEGKPIVYGEMHDLTGELSSIELAEALRLFNSEMRAHGVLSGGQKTDESKIRITLSETFTGRIWVVEYVKDGKPGVIVVSFDRRSDAASMTGKAPAQLQAQFVFEDADPILDFAILRATANALTEMLVLRPESLSLFRKDNGQWTLLRTQPIPHNAPLPRDTRGQLQLFLGQDDSFWADIPGTSCKGIVTQMDFSMKCDTSSKEWTFRIAQDALKGIEFAAGRNYFIDRDGKGQISRSYFASSGRVETQLDGQTFNWFGLAEPGILSNRWGSDIAEIPGCAGKPTLITTGDRDYSATDKLQAFALLKDTRADAISTRLEMDGPVTALQNQYMASVARAVVHNLKTGHYEAYQITLACNH